MKRKTKFQQKFTYILTLIVYILTFWILSFLIFQTVFSDNRVLAYIGNILLMVWVLIEDNLTSKAQEWLIKKIKTENILKKWIKKNLSAARYQPSMKSALYFYYIICLIVGRVLILDEGTFIAPTPFITQTIAYFSNIYYVLILLVAADKFKEQFIKERKHRNSYYAKYDGLQTSKKEFIR